MTKPEVYYGTNSNLAVTRVNTSRYGGRLLISIAPAVWNNLTVELRSACSVHAFSARLKTNLFEHAFS